MWQSISKFSSSQPLLGGIDLYYFYHSFRSGLAALLEALFARKRVDHLCGGWTNRGKERGEGGRGEGGGQEAGVCLLNPRMGQNQVNANYYIFEQDFKPREPALYCNALQRTATHCNALQRTITYCKALQHTAIYCHWAMCVAVHCLVLWWVALVCYNEKEMKRWARQPMRKRKGTKAKQKASLK